METTMATRAARAYLSIVAAQQHGDGLATLSQLIARVGPVEAAAVLMGRDGAPDPAWAGEELAALGEGGRLVIPEDDEWPCATLSMLLAPPVALWVQGTGNLIDLTERAVAVVGARAATAYGEHMAAELAYGLAEHGITVISGGSFGVEGAAHRAALTAHGPTVAVQPCGLTVPHPSAHARLLREIAEHGGAVLSAYPPSARVTRNRAVARTALIAALTNGVVVVEASRRSAALHTASAAAELHKVVMAVPGPVTSALSAGCHQLLRDADRGARLVTSAADVMEALHYQPEGPARWRGRAGRAPPPTVTE